MNARYLFPFQVIKRMTDGGADFSFECIGDTEMVTTALQSCCDVSSRIISVYVLLMRNDDIHK